MVESMIRKLCLVLLMLPLLQGCVAVLVGGVAAGANVAHDRRSVGRVLEDRNLQLSVVDKINQDKALVNDNNHVKVVVYDGVMLLCGQVRSDELKQRAQTIAESFEGISRLVNEIEVNDDPQGFWRRRQDNAQTARVKTALLDITSIPGFDPTRVNVTAAHGVVYLMGIVTREEDQAVTEVARNVGGVDKVVKVFEYLD
jgi:osmotically-inducible protein OsmY